MPVGTQASEAKEGTTVPGIRTHSKATRCSAVVVTSCRELLLRALSRSCAGRKIPERR